MTAVRETFQARSLFILLQAMDLLTTLTIFRMGGFEANPFVAQVIPLFGPVGAILITKTVMALLIWRVRKLIWLANLAYSGVVAWNLFVIVATFILRGS